MDPFQSIWANLRRLAICGRCFGDLWALFPSMHSLLHICVSLSEITGHKLSACYATWDRRQSSRRLHVTQRPL